MAFELFEDFDFFSLPDLPLGLSALTFLLVDEPNQNGYHYKKRALKINIVCVTRFTFRASGSWSTFYFRLIIGLTFHQPLPLKC